MTRNLVSPVIIRPKHGAFKGVPLVAVMDSGSWNGSCMKCVAWGDASIGTCRQLSIQCLGEDCAIKSYHYEHAGEKHDTQT